MADALLCAERRASFIHAWTDQLILTLGLWTGGGGRHSGKERCRSRQVMGILYLCEWPVTLIPNFDFYLNYMIFEGVTASFFFKTRQFETDGNVPPVYYFNIWLIWVHPGYYIGEPAESVKSQDRSWQRGCSFTHTVYYCCSLAKTYYFSTFQVQHRRSVINVSNDLILQVAKFF